jgi:hypothetical protein
MGTSRKNVRSGTGHNIAKEPEKNNKMTDDRIQMTDKTA